jgi:hypothetical protein
MVPARYLPVMCDRRKRRTEVRAALKRCLAEFCHRRGGPQAWWVAARAWKWRPKESCQCLML